jgi:diacylglycerol O-acyltransferase
MNRMSTLDAEFFFAEHDNVPMHMGSVAVFDGPAPAYTDVLRLFASKLPRVPRYRQVVRTVPGQLLRPVWTDDEHFTIRHQVHHATVPAPGDDEQLRAVAAKLFARRLDLSRPLWEEWFLDGLEGGRWAILSKVHHCMADGIGGNDLMTLVFDTDPQARPPEEVKWTPAPGPSLADRAADQLRDALTWPARQLAATSGQLRRAKPRDLLDFGLGLGESARRLAEPSAGFLNGPIGPRRRWAWTTTSLDGLKQIRKAHGGTVNDVVLAVIAGAFRDLLAERDKLADGLVVRSLVPVSTRGPDETGVVTNLVSAVLVLQRAHVAGSRDESCLPDAAAARPDRDHQRPWPAHPAVRPRPAHDGPAPVRADRQRGPDLDRDPFLPRYRLLRRHRRPRLRP